MTILKLQGAPGNKMVYFQQIFANSIMDYSSFLYHLQDSNKACIKEFNKLWISCIKSSFNIAKNTPNSQVTTALNLPTSMEHRAIRFIKVATQALKGKEFTTINRFYSLHQPKDSRSGRYLQDLRRYVVLRDEKENDPFKHKVRS